MRVSWKKKYLELVELIEAEEGFELQKSEKGYISYISRVEEARSNTVDGQLVEDNRSKFLSRLRESIDSQKAEKEEKEIESEVKEEDG